MNASSSIAPRAARRGPVLLGALLGLVLTSIVPVAHADPALVSPCWPPRCSTIKQPYTCDWAIPSAPLTYWKSRGSCSRTACTGSQTRAWPSKSWRTPAISWLDSHCTPLSGLDVR